MSEYILTNAELAILSLIAERPRHGYELEGVIEERGMRDWTEIAFSSIYFILNGLVRKGLAVSSLQPAAGRGPAKKVYNATPTGHTVLRDGIKQAVASASQDDRRFLLGLSCLPLLSQAEVERAFAERILYLKNKERQLSDHPALTTPGFPIHVHAMFGYSLALIHTGIQWSEEFLSAYIKGENHGKIGPQKNL